jgi:hypothetical protein
MNLFKSAVRQLTRSLDLLSSIGKASPARFLLK